MSLDSHGDGSWHGAESIKEHEKETALSLYEGEASKVGQKRLSAAHETSSQVQAGNLPDLSIVDHDGNKGHTKESSKPEQHWYTGALNVASDLGAGAVDEFVNHPVRVAGSLAVGALIAGAAKALGPEVALPAALIGAGVGAYELYENAPKWIDAAKVVAHPEDYSQSEQIAAHQTIKGVGAGGVDVAAGMIGSMGMAPFSMSGAADVVTSEAGGEIASATASEAGGEIASATASEAGGEIASSLEAKAAQAGYKDPNIYLMSTLEKPEEISSFVDSYAVKYPYGLKNLQFAADREWFHEGTQDLWKGAMDNAASSLKVRAVQAGFNNPDLYAMSTFEKPEEINDFVTAYASKYPHGLEDLRFAARNGWLKDGTEDIWGAAVRKLEAASPAA